MGSAWESLMKFLIDHHFQLTKKKRIRKQTQPWLDSTVLKHPDYLQIGTNTSSFVTKSPQWTERLGKITLETSSTKTEPKAFWDTLRQVLPSKNNRTEILKIVVDDKELIDKHEKIEYFTTIASSLLASQQSHGCSVDIQHDGPSPFSNHFFKFHAVSENDVFKVLRTKDVSKATGADSIPSKVIRTAAPYISNVVATLFNASFQWAAFRLFEKRLE